MIILLHGYGSSAIVSNTVNALKAHFLPEEVVVTPSYPSNKADETATYLRGVVNTALENNPLEAELVFIGISLGGFWARWLANEYPGSKLVMLNPALKAHETTRKYIDVDMSERLGTALKMTAEQPDAFAKYYVEADDPTLPITIIVAEDDDVIDPSIVLEEIGEERARIIRTTGGHRLDGTLSDHLKDIEYAVINLVL